MNARRIHDLMRAQFPELDAVHRDWIIVDRNGRLDDDALMALLLKNISAPVVLVEINRRTGCQLPLADVPPYVAPYLGQGFTIRIADRQFRGFVVVASNGVAAGWQVPAGEG